MSLQRTGGRDRQHEKWILLFTLTYLVSYLTRVNYVAVISEMVRATRFTKAQLSVAVIGSFIAYGAGQVFSGVLGDRVSPKKLVLLGLGLTTAMNVLLPLCQTPAGMAVVWSVNGLAQACMWPPLMKLMTALLTNEEYNRGIVRVVWGGSLGSIVVYLIAPVIILLAGWRGVFVFSAVCGAGMLVLWQCVCPAVQNVKRAQTQTAGEQMRIFTPVFFGMAAAVVVCGMLRDGVATWTPSLISESFQLDSAVGILSGAVLPAFGMLCHALAAYLQRRWLKNPLTCAGALFLLGLVSSMALKLGLGKSAGISLLAVALLNGSMHGVNLMLTAMVPAFYKRSGRIATVSGVVNSFVYIGSAGSTYGVAALSEAAGWGVTVALWLGLAAVGTAVCLLVARAWMREVTA